jgi:phenylacetate-coenzyme A ligase PaaK-like adenylate-forming protein
MERRRVAKKNSYFLKKLETMPLEAIRALQFERTRITLERAYHRSPF